jgi:general secretion pathway protein F
LADGLPLGPGLRALAAESTPTLRRALLAIADDVDSGTSLGEALASHADQFPSHWRALLEAGARSGRPGELAVGMLSDQDLGTQLRRQIWISLFYPLALLTVCGAVSMAIGVVFGREMGEIFRDFGVDLPWLTFELVRLAEGLTPPSPWLLIGPLILTCAFGYFAWRFVLSPTDRARVVGALPLFGPIHRYVSLSEMCRVLAWLLRAEVPLPEALAITAESTRNPLRWPRHARMRLARFAAGAALARRSHAAHPFLMVSRRS